MVKHRCARRSIWVSTGQQAESDLSIPDQRRQATAFCKAKGWGVVTEFVDAGLSSTDDNRPQLQRLLDIATGGGAPPSMPSSFIPSAASRANISRSNTTCGGCASITSGLFRSRKTSATIP